MLLAWFADFDEELTIYIYMVASAREFKTKCTTSACDACTRGVLLLLVVMVPCIRLQLQSHVVTVLLSTVLAIMSTLVLPAAAGLPTSGTTGMASARLPSSRLERLREWRKIRDGKDSNFKVCRTRSC